MRVTFFLKFKNFSGQLHLQPDYRIKIYSFLKELIKQSRPDLRNMLWGTDKKVNCVKPFTFSCFFPGIKAGDNASELKTDRFTLTVSFGNYLVPGLNINGYEIFFALYNGFIQNKHALQLSLNGTSHSLVFVRAVTHREKLGFISSPAVKLKTCAPLLIRKIMPGEKPRWLGFDDSEFGEWMKKSVVSLSRDFLGKSDFPVKFEPIKCKIVYLNHYRGLIKATAGIFMLEAPPEVIKLVYETGLGARRNQGFGMVEVVR
ncbi:MAG: CRISPR-associated endoribonuclease Cas6 [Spirochaetales bacterium]|nr:CRISPR-associated endoribonuclease Cas6 [Spirochaetales bacterium]